MNPKNLNQRVTLSEQEDQYNLAEVQMGHDVKGNLGGKTPGAWTPSCPDSKQTKTTDWSI